MKKYLPLLLVFLLAFAGCQSGPATYEKAKTPEEVVSHSEKFTNQVAKKSKHYTTEDWEAAVEQFVMMGKNYMEVHNYLTTEQQMRYDNARMKFMGAVDATGDEELALRVKEEYSKVLY